MKRASFVSIVLLIAISATSVIANPTTYTITDLGTLGGQSSWAQSINDYGQVVGYSWLSGNSAAHAFLYDSGMMTDLGTFGGTWSKARGINNYGEVVGRADGYAFLYHGTNMINLGTLGGTDSHAYDINIKGQIVGQSYISGNTTQHAFFYDEGVMTDLGTLGGTWSIAQGISNNEQVIGYSGLIGDSSYHAFFYDQGTMTDLGTLGGTHSYANDINNNSQIVGSSYLVGNSIQHAFLYENGVMTDLGTLDSVNSRANGINDTAQIVGSSGETAFIYENGSMYDLNNLIPVNSGWHLTSAEDINSKGQIVGSGTINQEAHAFLMTPLYEPYHFISIDIKPGKCPNKIHAKGNNPLQVAVCGSDIIDVYDIDVGSIEIWGVKPTKISYRDVATAKSEPPESGECLCDTNGRDGTVDLLIRFEKQEILDIIGQVSSTELPLTGHLKDGTNIVGIDCIEIVKMGID